jgi:hypothetical protein
MGDDMKPSNIEQTEKIHRLEAAVASLENSVAAFPAGNLDSKLLAHALREDNGGSSINSPDHDTEAILPTPLVKPVSDMVLPTPLVKPVSDMVVVRGKLRDALQDIFRMGYAGWIVHFAHEIFIY